MIFRTSGAWERDCHEVVNLFRDLEAEEGRLELLPVDDVAVVLVGEELDGGHNVWNEMRGLFCGLEAS